MAPILSTSRPGVLGRCCAAVGLVALLAGCGAQQPAHSASLDPAAALRKSWASYQREFIQGDGRVIDRSEQDVTTSEGQSYAMLRAAWMHDRGTFDNVWRWTQANLGVRGDALFAWRWGRGQDGSWKVLDIHSASDADQDIALALVFASREWRDQGYLRSARSILSGIWDQEVAQVRGEPVLVAGDWARTGHSGAVVNPSYLSPAAYRIFAGLDPSHRWSALVDGSYRTLSACSKSTLGGRTSVGLPPNWCVLGASGAQPYSGNPTDDAYGYDAFRAVWRIALDAGWFGSSQARSYLASVRFLRQQWQQKGSLAAEYDHDGNPLNAGRTDTTVYGGDVGAFMVSDPGDVGAILHRRLLASYHEQDGAAFWGDRTNYYEQNWVWFGVALASHNLPNLAS